MKRIFQKGAFLMLAFVMVLSVFATVPLTAEAGSVYVPSSDGYYELISQSDWDIAPGISESEIILNNESGNHRQVAHVMEVDINNPYTKVMPSYKGMAEGLEAKEYGSQKMSEQAAYAEENGYGNVVGAMNLSLRWYNGDYYGEHPELVGEPLGYVIMDGVQYTNSQGQSAEAESCLVINYDEKDGKARPSNIPKTQIRETSDPITGWEEQVIPANFGIILEDGVNTQKKSHDGDTPRSCVGIKEDGTIVIVMIDGRQAPYSTGFSRYEIAEFMLSLGCDYAILGDSGGSSTFLSQRPGEELEMQSSPSDGGERTTTHGILVFSTAPATGEFVRAHVSAEDDYYLPNAKVQFTAVGSDAVGTKTEIPESAYWKLSDSSMGTIEDGLFVSNGKTGEVTAQLVYNDTVVGKDTIKIVVPDKLAFEMEKTIVPFNGKITLKLSAVSGKNEVVIGDEDVAFTLSDKKMGNMKGNVFTATSDENVAGGTVTATLNCDKSIKATMEIMLGKASKIVYDFEEGADSIKDITAVYQSKYTPEVACFSETIEVVSQKDGGKVKNGENALRITSKNNSLTSMNWIYSGFKGWNIDLTDAVSVSFWLYVPEGSHGYRFYVGDIAMDLGHCKKHGTGWQYFTVDMEDIGTDVTTLNGIYLYKSDTDNIENDYLAAENPNYYTDVVFYMDDITVNYSKAVEDYIAPAIEDVMVNSVEPEGQTITTNKVSLTAKAADHAENGNYSGLDVESVKVYVDSNLINASCSNSGTITTDEIILADGMHTFRIEISDKNGNMKYVEKQIGISTGKGIDTIQYVPNNTALDHLLLDSVYWMDVVATDIENVQSAEMIVDLDNNNTWCLEYMTLASGFQAEYSIDEENNDATITISREGEITDSGEAVLASLPIRVWSPEHGNDTDRHRNVAVETFIEKGLLTKTDGDTVFFGSEKIVTKTESYGTRMNDGKLTDWHKTHDAKKVKDVAATCTAAGYKGRTYCLECESVVDWGTIIPATGHDLEKDSKGRLICKNEDDKLFTGIYKNKMYEDGVLLSGWNKSMTSYYEDGVKVTGQLVIDGKMYTFNENGLYQKNYLYTGFYYDEAAKKYMYFSYNEAMKGFVYIDKEWYYFDKKTYYAPTGTTTINGMKYEFEGDKGKVIGAWVHTDEGSSFYFCGTYYVNTWATIKGEKYYFDNEGYCYKGTSAVKESGKFIGAYEFDENGKFISNISGTFKDSRSGELYIADDGTLLGPGLVKWDGAIYCARSNYNLAVGERYVNKDSLNGILTKADTYTFGKDGKMDTSNVKSAVERVWGKSRYMTSLSIADELKAEMGVSRFSTVIIASGKNFPDALAGSYLAAKKNAPILMVEDTKATITLVQNYINKNLKSGGKIYILGGSAAVPESIEKNLNNAGYDVDRLKGKSRYETNIAILDEAGVKNEDILVCTGTNFADSLSASAAGLPILLVDPNTNTLTEEQKNFLNGKDSEILIIGGEGAVSDIYKSALISFDADKDVERVKGKSRYETSVEVANKFIKNPAEAVIAYAVNFPDGLCGGPLAYTKGAPLILTAAKNESVASAYMDEELIFIGTALGGDGVLPDSTVKTIFDMGKSDKITGTRYE